MLKSKRFLYVGASALAVLALLAAAFLTHRSANAAPALGRLAAVTVVGDTSIGSGTSGTVTSGANDQTPKELEGSPKKPNTPSKPLPPPPTNGPNPAGRAVTSNNEQQHGFNGLTHLDQRNAGTGIYTNTQFSLVPPDQALCTNGTYVFESVNNALAVYRTNGARVAGPTANSQFLNLVPEIDRTTGVQGDFISDPKCLWDQDTNRWFFTVLQEDPAPSVRSHTYIAVSKTSNPTGAWTIFRFDTTDDGLNGTPANQDCPCFGDQPLIGTDSNGFYVSNNEFSADTFNGTQLYAISKTKLAAKASGAGGDLSVVHIDAGPYLQPFGGTSYTLQPANRAYGDSDGDDRDNQRLKHGIEYFMSALQFGAPPYEEFDNRIAIWGLTNTSSLNTPAPNLSLYVSVIGSETYGQSGPMTQKGTVNAAQTPYAVSVGATGLMTITSNDDRMNQVVFAQGNLWSALNTVIGDGSRTGVAFFKVRPSWDHSGNLQARMIKQDYIAVNGNNTAYPSVAVNKGDQGIIAFTLVGPDYYPSAAYIRVDDRGIFGKVHVAAFGSGPDDDFSGYEGSDPVDGRWGDYSAGVAAPDGTIWVATEYIPSLPRTVLANWGTFINNVGTHTDN